jgi:hypothetical protein
MPNQPAKNGTTILIRLSQTMKAEIQAQVELLNTASPGARYTVSSWVRGLIETELTRAKKRAPKNQ